MNLFVLPSNLGSSLGLLGDLRQLSVAILFNEQAGSFWGWLEAM